MVGYSELTKKQVAIKFVITIFTAHSLTQSGIKEICGPSASRRIQNLQNIGGIDRNSLSLLLWPRRNVQLPGAGAVGTQR